MDLVAMINVVFISTAHKTKFSMKDFFSKCDQIYRIKIKIRILSQSLKKPRAVQFPERSLKLE